MDDLERLKILLYQYVLFKADYYKNTADSLYDNLRVKKYPSADDFHLVYTAQLKNEIFDNFQREIIKIISDFR